MFYVIFQKRVGVFHRGFKHKKTDESTRPHFIVFECLKPRWNTKHEFLKLLLQQKKISLNYHLNKFSLLYLRCEICMNLKKMCNMCMVLSPNCCTVTIFEYWVVPEKIRTPPTDGILEILAGGGVKDPGNPGRRGG